MAETQNLLPDKWRFNFYRIFIGQLFSGITSWTVQYALIWYMTMVYKSPSVLAFATLLATLPEIILAPFVGPYIDRLNKKWLLVGGDLVVASAAMMIAFSGNNGSLPLALVYTAVLIRSIAQTLQQPTLGSAIPTLVPKDFLVTANGQIGGFNALSMVLAPTLGFLAYSHMSISSVMWIDIVGAIIGSTTVLLSVIPSFNDRVVTETIWQDLGIGWRTMLGKPGVFQLAIVLTLMMVAFIPASSMYPLFTTEYFGMKLFHANLIETVFSVGMMVGGFAMGLFSGVKNRLVPILGSIIVMGLMFVISGLLPGNALGFWIFFATNVLAGLCVPVMSSFVQAITQESYQPEVLGRVMGVMMPMQSAAGPIGLLFAGPLAEQFGINQLFLWGGIAVIVVAVGAYLMPAIRHLDAERVM